LLFKWVNSCRYTAEVACGGHRFDVCAPVAESLPAIAAAIRRALAAASSSPHGSRGNSNGGNINGGGGFADQDQDEDAALFAKAEAAEEEAASRRRLETLLDETDLERGTLQTEACQAARGADAPTEDMYRQVQELLTLFGVPYVIAPQEAEAQCAWMNHAGLVDAVITDDSDAFLFGALNVYRNVFESKKYVEVYAADRIAAELGLDRARMAELALLLGSDYTEGVSGVGIVNALEVVTAFPGTEGLTDFREWVELSEFTGAVPKALLALPPAGNSSKGGKGGKGAKGVKLKDKGKGMGTEGNGGKGTKMATKKVAKRKAAGGGKKKSGDAGDEDADSDDENDDDYDQRDDEEEEEELPERAALAKLAVAALKALLAARGLPIAGRKDDLVQRLDESRGAREEDEEHGDVAAAAAADDDADKEEEEEEEQTLQEKQRARFKDQHRSVKKGWELPPVFPSTAVLEAYAKPSVDQSRERLEWGRPDLDLLRLFCLEHFNWHRPRTDELLLPVLKLWDKHDHQRRIDSFFTAAASQGGGLYTLNAVETHSLKPPGSQPLRL
jgi:hypothetical protein